MSALSDRDALLRGIRRWCSRRRHVRNAPRPRTVDLQAKPSWYNSKVNAASKVPVLVLNPSAESANGGGDESDGTVKLPESMVISEYIAEQYPDSGLHSTE